MQNCQNIPLPAPQKLPTLQATISVPTMDASGFTPSRSAACLVMSTTAAAPSFNVLALAAVTVPN